MKKILSKMTAAIAAGVLTICSFPIVSAAAESSGTITVSFDYTYEGASVEDETAFAPIEVSSSSNIIIPEGTLEREGYYHTGWTFDGVRAYTAGDVFSIPVDEDITLEPVWTEEEPENLYTASYFVEIDGEITDTSKKLPDRKYAPGQLVTIDLSIFDRNGYLQYGWTDGTNKFRGQEKLIMPENDVQLTPNWLKYYKLTYTPGDVDRINGVTTIELERVETLKTELAASDRFSRNGFNITGWLCDYDGVVYPTLYSKYLMPSADVTMTAVWEAKTYTVVFKQSTKNTDSIKITGKTDEAIITPEATITKAGYYLSGWKYNNEIYPVGSEFVIPGALPGLGISLEAVWTAGEAPTTEAPETVYGDANEDGEVGIADAVIILQSISNPDKYSLTATGKNNADVSDRGDGVTAKDALIIQQVEAKQISVSDLPLYKET